ncbi:hypothetical protein QT711_11445 [Sporosarcina saromensis]|uniref:Uncharacterized protein n=1 Tax=Sporosarcina saromensis TaxID=359365 RepID=A0ABU4GA01_9BACL|nr:hypothetical protein [Sporosarcina saromensis]MDW0113802.1 hypothetical protein [Sporosarcina saromensis]
MTGKVKVTKEVAEAIEKLRNADLTDYGIVVKVSKSNRLDTQQMHKECAAIRKWTHQGHGINADKLLDALRTGYEIDDEYKVGDWVVYVPYITEIYVGKVEDLLSDGFIQTDIYAGCKEKQAFSPKNIRHATPDEIEAEKERRVWAGIGRAVGEFRVGDYGLLGNYIFRKAVEGNDLAQLKDDYSKGKLIGFFPAESFIEFGGGEE